MDLTALVVFASALVVAAASPGPGIAAIVARVLGNGVLGNGVLGNGVLGNGVLGNGMTGAFALAAGVALGDVVWLSFAVLGLAVLAQAFGAIFTIIKSAGAAYLLYLGWQLWTTPANPANVSGSASREGSARLFLGGLAVTMGNPKVMIFYLALLPNITDLNHVSLAGWAILAVVTLSVLATVFGSYIILAARARRLLMSGRAMRLINRMTGGVMVSAAAAIATR
jgi:threonine/homoserine/homoserine lactone efflux protein